MHKHVRNAVLSSFIKRAQTAADRFFFGPKWTWKPVFDIIHSPRKRAHSQLCCCYYIVIAFLATIQIAAAFCYCFLFFLCFLFLVLFPCCHCWLFCYCTKHCYLPYTHTYIRTYVLYVRGGNCMLCCCWGGISSRINLSFAYSAYFQLNTQLHSASYPTMAAYIFTYWHINTYVYIIYTIAQRYKQQYPCRKTFISQSCHALQSYKILVLHLVTWLVGSCIELDEVESACHFLLFCSVFAKLL